MAVAQALKRLTNYEKGNVEDDCADSDIDSDCTGDDAGSDVVYVTKREKESWARECSALFFLDVYGELLVHLELGVAILEEGVDLLGSSDTSVDIGLGCLSPIFLGVEK